ncbi:uncharacterized protein LOC142776012 [Rhipicephalus microplus]|uniref:uncharacterized protein LOC142776012 n=1 Tax=Rhipicephalus microplus TaxID=6941 RepID=UPI003F6A905E
MDRMQWRTEEIEEALFLRFKHACSANFPIRGPISNGRPKRLLLAWGSSTCGRHAPEEKKELFNQATLCIAARVTPEATMRKSPTTRVLPPGQNMVRKLLLSMVPLSKR